MKKQTYNEFAMKYRFYKMTFNIIVCIIILGIVLLSMGYLINKTNENSFDEGYELGFNEGRASMYEGIMYSLQTVGYVSLMNENNYTIILVPYVGGEE